MSVHVDIRGALQTALAGVSGVPDINYDTMPKNPTKGTPYIACAYIPVDSDRETIGASPSMDYTGEFLIRLHYPSGKGTSDIETMAGTIREAFPLDGSLSQNGVSVNIRSNTRSNIEPDTDWISLDVSIGWYTYSKRY